MGFEGYIAWRHMTRRRKAGFISLISFISVLGIGVGVMALIVVLSVMSGFNRELKDKMVSVHPHIRIEKYGGMDRPESEIANVRSANIPGLKTVASFVAGEAVLRSEAGATGVVVRGVDWRNEDLAIFQRNMTSGSLDFEDRVAQETKRSGFFGTKTVEMRTGSVVIGEWLAASLRVRVGDIVTLITPPLGDSTVSLLFPKAEARPLIVKGIFRIGMNDFDSNFALIDIPQAQAAFHLGTRVNGLSLRFQDVDDALRWQMILRSRYDTDYVIRSWHDVNPNFFQALKVEKSVMTIIVSLIICVAAFNIFSVLIMVVMEKTKDIGVLRALGATRAGIRRIFVIQGFCLGFMGVALGTATGLLMVLYRNPILDFIKQTTGFELFPHDIYLFDGLPAQINPDDIIMIVCLALATSVAAGFYPAHLAAKLHPVDALRYE